MTTTPFRDTATKLSRTMDYVDMSYKSGRARSHGWWRNLVEHGAWNGPGTTRVGPPSPEALEGIAELFGMTLEQVSTMVAADWYNVHQDVSISPRALQLSTILDQLSDEDADLVESVAKRLAKPA